MSQAGRNPRVDAIIAGSARWREEMQALREVVLESGLREDVKWGQPCYTLDDKNVVVIHGFKDYCALLFFKGALMKDPDEPADPADRERAGRPADPFRGDRRDRRRQIGSEGLCRRRD